MAPVQKTTSRNILVDAREFTPQRVTGIGRVIEGLVDALAESSVVEKIILAMFDPTIVPSGLKNRRKIEIKKVPVSFFKSERALSNLSKDGIKLFLSPYPKLPLFGVHCPSINMIHDVLDLTHPAYKGRIKVLFDGYRLKRALRKADLTWYVSSWSFDETKRFAGFAGNDPRVRFNGIDESFTPTRGENEGEILAKYQLSSGYILAVGNGLPHKNLGAVLKVAGQLGRGIVFAGVSERNQAHWKWKYPEARAVWISHVTQEDLPAIMRGAFCLVQPSTEEGYGYPPLEAMASGVPAIVSKIPVLVETTGGCALTSDPNNPNSWTEAVGALENRSIYREQVMKGLELVGPLQGRNGWQKHVADIENILLMK
jgi:glycosyltransferase involved in cell wall biosynthesis